MNNIIKSQMFLCKKHIWFFVICSGILLPCSFFFLSFLSLTETFGTLGILMVLLVICIPCFVIPKSYSERIQLYEIMAGFKPHQVLLGKALVYLPFTLLSLVFSSVMVLAFDHSAEIIHRLLLLCVICIRATLCIVFLSPLLKESTGAPATSVMLLMFYSDSNVPELAHTPLSFLAFGQGILLSLPVTESYVIKVIVSAAVSCTIYYFIGYFALKKKFNLEPHKIT